MAATSATHDITGGKDIRENDLKTTERCFPKNEGDERKQDTSSLKIRQAKE